MTAPLSVAQRLTLAKYLTDGLKNAREKDMLPQAAAEMPSGTRLPVFFDGKQAGWASMPQPSKKAAYVSDEKALLAWAEKHLPAKVGTEYGVRVTDEVLAVLRQHLPGAITETRKVDPQWLADVLGALRGGGSYVTREGERLTSVPGIEVPEPVPPVPHVDLVADAATVIGGAWQAGEIPFAELLALPAANGNGAA
jgi:hypothetical protein